MYHPFSVTETIRIAWHILKKNFSTIAVYTLLAFAIIVGTGFIVDYIIIGVFLESVEVVFSILLVSFIFLGFIKLVFQLIDKEYYDFEFKDILPQIKMLLSYIILLVIVSTVYVFINQAIKRLDDGIIQHLLGIFAAIFVEIFFLFYFPICACFIVDDNSGPFESVAQSYNLIKGHFLKYLLLFIFIELLVFVGTLTVVGIIFAVPFVNILLVVAYRKLIYSNQDVDDDVTEAV